MPRSSDKKQSVVILGGGHAGTALARSLSSKLDPARYTLTLINARPFLIFYPSMIRVAVSSKHGLDGRVFMPYDKLFTKIGSFKLGSAIAVEKRATGGGDVVLNNGERVPFDILAVASGSTWSGPLAIPETTEKSNEWLDQNRTKIATAKHIVLVGGGAVGSEFAGEIKDAYPDTQVTIVHGKSQMFSDAYPDKFRNAVAQSLRTRDIDIIFDDHVDVIPESGVSHITTRRGKRIAADLVLSTVGPRPNTGFLSSLGAATLATSGHVKVKPTLQLVSHPDIFALGDILDVKEQKQAGKVHAHADVVSANILSLLEGKEATSVYKGSYEMIVVTNGKNGGVAYFGVLWGLLFGNWVSALIKSKTLLVPMGRKAMGLLD